MSWEASGMPWRSRGRLGRALGALGDFGNALECFRDALGTPLNAFGTPWGASLEPFKRTCSTIWLDEARTSYPTYLKIDFDSILDAPEPSNLCKRHLAVLPRTVHLCLQHQSFDLPQMFLAGVCAKGHERYVRKAMGSMLEMRWVLIASSKNLATSIFKKFHNIDNDLLRAQICVIRL